MGQNIVDLSNLEDDDLINELKNTGKLFSVLHIPGKLKSGDCSEEFWS